MRIVSLLFHDVYARDPGESGFVSPAANRYKLTAAEFDAQLAGVASLTGARAVTARELLEGAPPEGAFTITVDDGGSSYLDGIAGRLERRGWRGHCFIATECIGRRGFLDAAGLRELRARGHVIGSHSVSHPTRFSACSRDRMLDEWTRSRCALQDLLGEPVTTASLPGGFYSRAVAETAAAAGFALLFTSEPTTRTWVIDGCLVAGRYAMRRGAPAGLARRLVERAPWTRRRAWIVWNARGLAKPLLGPLYPRLADWVSGDRLRSAGYGATTRLRRSL